jgi:transposase
MNNEIRASYNDVYLLPPSVEEWIPADHRVRFIREFVESLDLDAMGFKSRAAEVGAPSYSADLLLKVWLYGYMTEIRSTRNLERSCLDSIAMVWLTGNRAPDHNTLWRFLNSNRAVLKKLCRQTIRMAADRGLVGLIVHAVDGTKVQAHPAAAKGLRREKLTELLKKLDESVEKAFEEIDANEAEETGEVRLPEELCDRAALRQWIEESLRDMDEAGVDNLHPDDPDARMVKVKGKSEFCYNAQAVVDSESGMIVGEDVVSECNDNGLINRMLDEVEENVGVVAVKSVADAGYFSTKELEDAEERDRGVLVNMENLNCSDREDEFCAAKFSYDEDRDCVVCPLGHDLKFNGISPGVKGKVYRVYRCRRRDCPSRSKCTKNKQGRSIKIGQHHPAMVRQREKQRSVENRWLLSRRKTIIEPVFGIIKEVMGLRRWSVIGIEKVRAAWSLVCTVFNLRKMYGYWLSGKLRLSSA